MSDLYNVLLRLCNEREITGYRMCKDVGIQPSIMTDLKMGRRSGLKAETAQKIADYFGVSVGYLLGEEQKEVPTKTDEHRTTDEDLMFALWGDSEDIDEDDLEDVRRYAAFVRERKRKNDKTR